MDGRAGCLTPMECVPSVWIHVVAVDFVMESSKSLAGFGTVIGPVHQVKMSISSVLWPVFEVNCSRSLGLALKHGSKGSILKFSLLMEEVGPSVECYASFMST